MGSLIFTFVGWAKLNDYKISQLLYKKNAKIIGELQTMMLEQRSKYQKCVENINNKYL